MSDKKTTKKGDKKLPTWYEKPSPGSKWGLKKSMWAGDPFTTDNDNPA